MPASQSTVMTRAALGSQAVLEEEEESLQVKSLKEEIALLK